MSGETMDYGSAAIPPDYQASLESTAPGITQILDSAQVPGENWSTTLQRVMTGLVATEQQRQLLQIQLTRAQQGLPPLDASAYGMGVNVGLSPQTLNALMLGGIALAVVFFMSRKR